MGVYPMHPNNRMRRNHERKRYQADIIFSHKKQPYAGSLENISLGGAYIISQSVNQFSSGDIVIMSIPFTTGKKSIRRKACVRWLNNEGFAVEFIN